MTDEVKTAPPNEEQKQEGTVKVEQNGQTDESQMDASDSNPNPGHAIVAGKKREFEQKKIFIGDIDIATTQDDLKEYFGKYGEITNVDLKNSGKKNRIIRFGFISFIDHSSVEEVLKTAPHKIKDKDVTVKQALIKPALKKVCISGLSKDVKEEQIKAHFEKYGVIESLQMATEDNEFITLTFETEAVANEACKEATHTIENHSCTVQKAESAKKAKAKKKNKSYWFRRGMYQRGGYNNFGGRYPNDPPQYGMGGPRNYNPSGYNHFNNEYNPPPPPPPPQRFGGPGGYGNRSNFGGTPNYGPSNYGSGPSYNRGPSYGNRPYNNGPSMDRNYGGPSNYGPPPSYNEPRYDEPPHYRSNYRNEPQGYEEHSGGYGPRQYENNSNYKSPSSYGGNYGGNRQQQQQQQNYGGGYGDNSRMGSYNDEPSNFGKSRSMRGGMAFHPYEY